MVCVLYKANHIKHNYKILNISVYIVSTLPILKVSNLLTIFVIWALNDLNQYSKAFNIILDYWFVFLLSDY